MYIEFYLPSGAGGMSAAVRAMKIREEIKSWAEQYHVPYKVKTVKYTLRLCLQSDEAYTHFQISWAPAQDFKYNIVHPQS